MKIGVKKGRGAHERLSGEAGRTVLETVFAVIIVALLLLTALDRYTSSVKILKETAMRQEISNLRSAVIFYVMINKKLPVSLDRLVRENVVMTKNAVEGRDYNILILGKYVEATASDKDGYPLDPFGNRYNYDPKTGRVSAATKGYENW